MFGSRSNVSSTRKTDYETREMIFSESFHYNAPLSTLGYNYYLSFLLLEYINQQLSKVMTHCHSMTCPFSLDFIRGQTDSPSFFASHLQFKE